MLTHEGMAFDNWSGLHIFVLLPYPFPYDIYIIGDEGGIEGYHYGIDRRSRWRIY